MLNWSHYLAVAMFDVAVNGSPRNPALRVRVLMANVRRSERLSVGA